MKKDVVKKDTRPALALLNTSIITADGDFSLKTITLDEAKELINNANGLDSAIGHDSTAQIMTGRCSSISRDSARRRANSSRQKKSRKSATVSKF